MSGNQILTGQNFGRRTAVTPIGKKGRDGPNPLRVRERESRAEIKLNHLTDPSVRSCGTGDAHGIVRAEAFPCSPGHLTGHRRADRAKS